MKETASIFLPRSRRGQGDACLPRTTLLLLISLIGAWSILGGCGDPRTAPATSPSPSHSQTIELWNQATSSGQRLQADFMVDRALADVENPALLTLVAYVEPVGALARWDVVVDSLAWLDNGLERYAFQLFQLPRNLETLDGIDSLWQLYPDSMVLAFDSASCDTHATICGDTIRCDSLNWAMYPDSMVLAFDTIGHGNCRIYINNLIDSYNDSTVWASAQVARLEPERDSLAPILDDRYTLAVWMDDDTTTRYPEAVFVDSSYHLGGQSIYSVVPDTLTGLKARGFEVDMKQFQSCDPVNINETQEVNWVTCFLGSTRPCLLPEVQHTLWVRVNGENTKITGTLVLVYAEEGP